MNEFSVRRPFRRRSLQRRQRTPIEIASQVAEELVREGRARRPVDGVGRTQSASHLSRSEQAEYCKSGTLIREMLLQEGIVYPPYTVQLTSHQFVV